MSAATAALFDPPERNAPNGIRHQPESNRFLEQRAEAIDESTVVQTLQVGIRPLAEGPKLLNLHAAITNTSRCPGSSLVDAFEQCVGTDVSRVARTSDSTAI